MYPSKRWRRQRTAPVPLSACRGCRDTAWPLDRGDGRSRTNYCPHPVRASRAKSARRATMAHQVWAGAGSHRSAVWPVTGNRPLGCRQTAAAATVGDPELDRVAARSVGGSCSIHCRFSDVIVAGPMYSTAFSVYLCSVLFRVRSVLFLADPVYRNSWSTSRAPAHSTCPSRHLCWPAPLSRSALASAAAARDLALLHELHPRIIGGVQ